MPNLRQTQGVFAEIWNLSYLLPESGFTGKTAGGLEIELVVDKSSAMIYQQQSTNDNPIDQNSLELPATENISMLEMAV